jgi:hypothetical protein
MEALLFYSLWATQQLVILLALLPRTYQCHRDENRDKTLDSYIEAIRQLLAARKCVKPVFNPADEKLAAQLFKEQGELKQIEHAVLLACGRWYMALLNGTGLELISVWDISAQSLRRFGSSEYRTATGSIWPHGLPSLNNNGSKVRKTPRAPGPVRSSSMDSRGPLNATRLSAVYC